MPNGSDIHDFVVTAVEPIADIDHVAITLLDARGGRVRLHFTESTAEQVRDLIIEGLATPGDQAEREL